MLIIEFCGGTSVGKTTLIKELNLQSKRVITAYNYIFQWLKIRRTKWTYIFILHPFLYFHFLRLCIRKRYFFAFFFSYF
jgi:hypothetical protein